jgi:hypothetical protein
MLPPVPDDDLYARLQVMPRATAEEIEAAWRRLALRHHPDVVGASAAATLTMQQLNVARDWLIDLERRAHYDAIRGIASRAVHGRPPQAGAKRAKRPRGGAFDPFAADFGPHTPAVRDFLRSVADLTTEQLEVLAADWAAPSVGEFLRFMPSDLRSAWDRFVEAVEALLPAGPPATRSLALPAILAAGFYALAGDWLRGEVEFKDYEDFCARLRRAWRRATLEPRWGSAHAEIAAYLQDVRRLSAEDAGSYLGRVKLPRPEWPRDPLDSLNSSDGVLSQLLSRDARAAVSSIGMPRDREANLARVVGRIAAALALPGVPEREAYLRARRWIDPEVARRESAEERRERLLALAILGPLLAGVVVWEAGRPWLVGIIALLSALSMLAARLAGVAPAGDEKKPLARGDGLD